MDGPHAVTQTRSSFREKRFVFRMDRYDDVGNPGMSQQGIKGAANDRPAANPAILLRSFGGLASPFTPTRRDDHSADRRMRRNIP